MVEKAQRTFADDFVLTKLFQQTDEFNIKLSDLEALYPSLTFELRLNIQELTKSNMRLLRCFLFFYYTTDKPEWVEYLIEEELDRLLPTVGFETKGKVFRENLIIRQSFLLLGPIQGLDLLQSIYSSSNIDKWKKTGKSLSKSYSTVKIPKVHLKQKIRRRGYKESSSNKHISKNQEGEIRMSEEYRQLQEAKLRIQLKQAKLFEQRLDHYLAISSETDATVRKEIFSKLLEAEPIKNQEVVEEATQKNLLKEERNDLNEY